MPDEPTYVVGAGGAGVDVVRALSGQAAGSTSHMEFLAVDSDRDALDRLESGVATVHLGSDAGIVDQSLAAYRYLSTDVMVPAGDANGQRHVGRYKLDNPTSPDFQSHLSTLQRRIQSFFRRQAGQIGSRIESCNVLLVASLGGGTGSGTLPLLAAVLDHVGTRIAEEERIDVRLFGVGIVPRLAFDPEYAAPPSKPVAYPNTYGALRNLTALLDDEGGPLTLPVYSGGPEAGPSDGEAGTSFRFSTPVFDGYWIVSSSVERGQERSNPGVAASTVAHAIRALTGHATPGTDRGSTFGTIGYAGLAVPHEDVRTFCARRRERDSIRTRLDQLVEGGLEVLSDRKDILERTLDRGIEDGSGVVAGWKGRIREELPDGAPWDREFVDGTDRMEMEAALGRIRAEDGIRSYYLASTTLAHVLSSGAVATDVRESALAAISDAQGRYDLSLPIERDGGPESVSEQLAEIRGELRDRIETCREQLAGADPGLLDFLPPTGEGFASESERLQERLDRLEADHERVGDAQERVEALVAMEELAREHAVDGREALTTRLERIQAAIGRLRGQKAKLQNRLEELDRELASLEVALANPTDRGPIHVLPIDRESLRETSLETLETDVDCLADYHERGLLAVTDEELRTRLVECYRQSSTWPKAISEHRTSAAVSTHVETTILYHRSNEPLLENIPSSITDSNVVRTPADQEVEYTDDRFRIEAVSVSQGGSPETLVGFELLEEMKEDGQFEAMAGSYRDHRRAVAYPEWYGSEIADSFD